MLKFKIFHKLAISYFLIGVVTVIIISMIFYNAFKTALIERTSAQLSSINILKKIQIENYFKYREINLKLFSHNPLLQQAALFYYGHRKESSVRLQYDQDMLNLEKDLNGKELILLDTIGNVLYPVSSSKPLYTLIAQKTNDHKPLNDFLKKGKTDFSLFDATQLIKAAQSMILISVPLKRKDRIIGSIVFYKNFMDLENILFERTGMGKTGESYLVASDRYMRSSSRFFPERKPYTIKVSTIAVSKAFHNIESTAIIHDYREVQVLSAFRKLKIAGFDWVIISEIDYQEALLPVYEIRNYIIITGLILIVIIILITLFLSRKISNPILELKETVIQLSQGILPEEVKVLTTDEVGEMTIAIDELINGLKRTSSFAYQIGNGNFKAKFEPLSQQDTLGISLLQMRDKLKLLQQKEAVLMRERSSALLEGQEKERRRIAMELHDGIGQMLTVIRFKISALDGQEVFQKETKGLLDDTIAEVRRISNNVMPSVLLDFGLVSALKTLCSNTQKYTELIVNFSYIQETEMEINFESSVSLYRIAQEALNNIVKYAKAKSVQVLLKQDESAVTLEIEDDGQGFDIEEYNRLGKLSNGIKNMRERISLLQGNFQIKSTKNGGTRIDAEIPLLGKLE